MNRTTPMKRTAFKAKPAVSHETRPKAKTCANRECRCKFNPTRPMQKVCGPACALVVGRIKAVKVLEERAKAEMANDRARKEKLKSPSEWEYDCRQIMQAIARLRDKDDGCISCHMGSNYGGQWHGSHFRTAVAGSAVQFHLWNIHKACAQCNLFKSGNRAEYEPRLIAKIGQDKVDWLLSQNQPVKHSTEWFKRFKRVMGKRLRRMLKRGFA